MKKVWELLYYGGVTRENYKKIYRDVDEANRRSVIAYSAISMAAFGIMYIFSVAGENAVSKNRNFYIVALLIMAVFIAVNLWISPERPIYIHLTEYFFVIVLLGVGILLAVSSKEDVTASYMVFLFVAPLLFTFRPLYLDITILACDLVYILYMRQIQIPELYQKNMINAVIYGCVSIIVSNTMIEMKMQKFETDYRNRMLMETDQLTGMLNRHSFAEHVSKIREYGDVSGIKVGAFDVNGLKRINDQIGHHAGDELIQGAANCLENAFSRYGSCYRIGGDEFIAILQSGSPSEEELMELLDKQIADYKGMYVPELSISGGIVVGEYGNTMDELLRQADAKMYQSKARYYQQAGIDRRKR